MSITHRSSILSLLLICLRAGSATAQIPVEHRLDNGLLVLIVANPALSGVEVTTTYFAGIRDEPDSLRGLAHLAEHMAMREVRSGGTMATHLARYGTGGSASTSATSTSFFFSGRGTDSVVRAAMRLERWRMTELSLLPSALEAERARILVETGNRTAPDTVRRALFGSSRLARSSSHQNLDRISIVHVHDFLARYYTPANALIVIRSPIRPEIVSRIVADELGPVSKSAAQPRPVFRDSAAIPARSVTLLASPTATGSRRDLVVAATAPGLQDVRRPALEREVDALRRRLPSDSGFTVDLTDDAPVSILTIRRPSRTEETAASVVAMLERLLSNRQGQTTTAGVREPPPWTDCEAAGSWRYCIDAAAARRRVSADSGSLVELAASLNLKADGSRSAPRLWPAPLRPPPSSTDSTIMTAASVWTDPDTSGFHWISGPNGLRWTSVRGGRADTAFVSAWIALPANASHHVIAASEVFARSWERLRLPNGVAVSDSLKRLGASVKVAVLPYPPLATTDEFRMLSTLPTLPGVAGIQLDGTAPRDRIGALIRLLADATLFARADSVAVQSVIDKQTSLIADAMKASFMPIEVAFRRGLPIRFLASDGAWRPQTLPTQLDQMRTLGVSDVNEIPFVLRTAGRARLAILGASEADAAEWIRVSAWSQLRGLELQLADSCAPVLERNRVPTPKPSGEIAFALCIQPSTLASIPALLLANAILGGREDAMLAARLRGQTGLAYGFESRIMIAADRPSAVWTLRIGTQPTKVDTAVKEVLQTLERVAQNGIPDDVFTDFREWLATQRVDRARTGAGWISSLLSTGLTPAHQAAGIRQVTRSQVNDLLRLWAPRNVAVTSN